MRHVVGVIRGSYEVNSSSVEEPDAFLRIEER